MRNLFLLATAIGLCVSGCQVTQAALKSDDGRTVARSIQDINAQRAMRARMLRAHGFKLGGVDVEVREGSALLTGRVPRVEDRIEAERIAWSAPGIASLGNEIHVGDKQGVFRNAKDGVLEKSVRTRLVANAEVDAIDMNVETHNGTVYLLGMVDSERERDAATRIASTTRGTKEVISYLKVKDVRSAKAAPATPFPATPLPATPLPATPLLATPPPATPPATALMAPHASATPAPAWELPEETVGVAPIVPQAAIPHSPLADMAVGGEVTIDPSAPYYRDPVTGERITLPSGTPPGTMVAPVGEAETIEIPADAGQGAPFYIDPDNGERVPVIYRNDG